MIDPNKAIFPADEPMHSPTPTPWAVWCDCAGQRTLMFLTRAFYEWQMNDPDSTWRCPVCLQAHRSWDDDNYESMMDAEEDDGTKPD